MPDRVQHFADASLELTRQDSECCYAYIVRCGDGTLYTGWTNDLEKRLKAHNEGTGSRYTRARRPVELVYCEGFASKREAMSRERAIKKMTRTAKQRLTENAASGSFRGASPP
ncbi:MAG: GIY-YIG nuclease family protein [Synergistaceae bacterium]|jgi:putative endonuclease|nr:GIY-YIG nuclease family protein [Synergistaceae bacterium]